MREIIITKQYVNFLPKTGELFSVGPSVEDGYEHLEVTEQELEPIKTFKDKMEDYRVIFERNRYVLKKVSSIEKYFNLVKVEKDGTFDIKLVLDKSQNLCYISNIQDMNLDQDIMFSITKSDDPHILYQCLDFNMKNKATAQIKCELENYGVYTDCQNLRCVYEEI